MMEITEMLEEAKKLQKDIERIQKQVETEEFTITSDANDVTIKVTGDNKFTSLVIAESLKKTSGDALEKTVLATIQKAIDAVRKKNEEAMKKITASLALPTLDEIKAVAQKAPKIDENQG